MKCGRLRNRTVRTGGGERILAKVLPRYLSSRAPTHCQHHVSGGGGRHVGSALIAPLREIEAIEEMLAGPQKPGCNRNVQLVDQARFEVLADRGYAATAFHIPSFPRLPPSFQRPPGPA